MKYSPWFLLTLGCTLNAQTPVTAVANTIRTAVDTRHAAESVERVYSTDRWFTFPAFEKTAAYLESRLKQVGLENIEIGGATADGVTQAGFWTMPLAWDAIRARLELTSPASEVLCDYRSVPTCLGMWSGSTPIAGIDAELVEFKSTPREQLKGKFVLTEKNAANLKYELVQAGALGAVNAFTENPDLQDDRQWVNAWGDYGWGFTKTSTPLLCYSITPRQAKRLRDLLASGQKVMLRAQADTRFYAGRYPWVTAVLPGSEPGEEVLTLGHTSEQGAHDNATGVSAMVEAVATLKRLIETGKLPRPRRSIRVLLMPELYGSLSYISANPARMKTTVAAITVDTPAAPYGLAGTEYTLYMNPHVAKSWTDALIARVTEACLPAGRPWHISEHMTGTDAYLGEPSVGVPDVWLYSGTGVTTHHNSADKPDTVDERSMRDLVSIVATYLYVNAAATEREIPWLAAITVDRAYTDIQSAASTAIAAIAAGDTAAGAFGLDRVRYFSDRSEEAVLSVLRLASAAGQGTARNKLNPELLRIRRFRDEQIARLRDAGAQPAKRAADPQASSIVVRRKRIGTLPLDDLPKNQWGGYPSGAWDKLVTVALYWCDGKRNLAEVAHLTEMEMGHPVKFDFVGYFRFLKQHGYVDFAGQ